ncbi:MAG TPA: hypothetical protein VJ969_08410 [Desulfopila sp.]|nr:hypothetical protein [Desulfopila sp.]
MAGKIFYRQRTKIEKGGQTPRFRIIAVSELDLKIYGNHLRKKELKHIAKNAMPNSWPAIRMTWLSRDPVWKSSRTAR